MASHFSSVPRKGIERIGELYEQSELAFSLVGIEAKEGNLVQESINLSARRVSALREIRVSWRKGSDWIFPTGRESI